MANGFGRPDAYWIRNIQANPDEEVMVGSKHRTTDLTLRHVRLTKLSGAVSLFAMGGTREIIRAGTFYQSQLALLERVCISK